MSSHKEHRIRLRLADNGFARDVEAALLENGFTVKREKIEGGKHVDLVFWGGGDGYLFIEDAP